ncbi:MAG: hypothetical protein ACRDHJ_01860 [Actinomycetota bacterium]
MKHELERGWPEESEASGARHAQSWETFFAAAEGGPGGDMGEQALDAEAAAVLARHESELLRYPNVVGAAVGVRTRGGKPTGEPCLVIYVERKVPQSELAEGETLPRQVEGVPVDVVPVGRVRPLAP